MYSLEELERVMEVSDIIICVMEHIEKPATMLEEFWGDKFVAFQHYTIFHNDGDMEEAVNQAIHIGIGIALARCKDGKVWDGEHWVDKESVDAKNQR